MTIGSFSPDSLSADFYMNKKLTVKRIDEIQNLLNDVFCLKCSIIDTLFDELDMIREMRVEAKIDQHSSKNILDIVNPTEPHISKILCSILSSTQNNDFFFFRSFTENFLSRCGFNNKWIKQPVLYCESTYFL